MTRPLPPPRRRPHPLPALLLALLLAACAERASIDINLLKPAGLDLSRAAGQLEILLLDGNTGLSLERATRPLSSLASTQRIFEALSMLQGRTYAMQLRVTLDKTDKTCGTAGGGRVVGRSATFVYRDDLNRVTVYMDCADRFNSTGGMSSQRGYHAAAALPGPGPGGRALVAGGGALSLQNLADLSKATLHAGLEQYNADTGQFTPLGPRLSRPRIMHRALALASGALVLSGGLDIKKDTKTLEAVDLVERLEGNTVRGLTSMLLPRSSHAAALVSQDRLLLSGGLGGVGFYTYEVYDPGKGQRVTTSAVKMLEPRVHHVAVPLGDGRRVLLAGGRRDALKATREEIVCLSGKCDCGAPPCSSGVSGFPAGQGRFYLSGTRVPCKTGGGAVYLVGGSRNPVTTKDILFKDIYCLALDKPTKLTKVGQLKQARAAHTTTLIRGKNGGQRLLVVGGAAGLSNTQAELVKVTCGCKSIPASDVSVINNKRWRQGHSATLLDDGSVLVAGGILESSAERFVPDL